MLEGQGASSKLIINTVKICQEKIRMSLRQTLKNEL